MGDLTLSELTARWEKTMAATQKAVNRHPEQYRALKALVGEILDNPLDIKDYLPTTQMLMGLLKTLDPNCEGSLFHYFQDKISPTSIWHIKLLRVECKDLLACLADFDAWRMKQRNIKIVK